MADIDIFETREMIEPLNTTFKPRSFLLNTFFPMTETHDVSAIDIDIYKGKRRMAPFVSPKAKGRIMKRDARRAMTYRPPYLKPKRSTNAEDVLKRALGQTPYSGAPSPMDRAAQILAEDLAELTLYIERREEWMAAQALFTGVVPVKGEVDEGDEAAIVDDEIDFLMAANHKITLTGAALWTDAASKPILDLRTWKRRISQDSGRTARVAVLGQSVVDPFLDHAQVKTRLDNLRMEMGQITPMELPDGVTYLGYLADPGLDLYTYDDWYVDDAGVEQPMVPVDRVVIGATNAKAVRHYGPIQDLDAIEEGMVETRWYPKSWREKDPSHRFVMVQSAPLVVPHEVDAFLNAKVV